MIKIFVSVTAIFLSVWAPKEAKAFPLKAGLIGYGDLVPLPAIVVETEVLPGVSAEFTGGTLLLAGAADVGLKYKLPISSNVKPTFGIRSGLNYGLSHSSLYYAATVGMHYEKWDFDVGPTWYYRRDTEYSRNFKTKVNVFAGVVYNVSPSP